MNTIHFIELFYKIEANDPILHKVLRNWEAQSIEFPKELTLPSETMQNFIRRVMDGERCGPVPCPPPPAVHGTPAPDQALTAHDASHSRSPDQCALLSPLLPLCVRVPMRRLDGLARCAQRLLVFLTRRLSFRPRRCVGRHPPTAAPRSPHVVDVGSA